MKCIGNINVSNSTLSIIIATLMALAFISYCTPAHAAGQVKREGNVFSIVQENEGKTIETNLWFTTKDGKMYQIYLSKNGHAYIKRISGKTGNEYKQYLPEEISRQACKEYNVTYKPSTKKAQ